MAKYLVTGGTGFIGNRITRKLVEMGHEVIITGSPTEIKVKNVTVLECHLTGIDFERIGDIEGCFHQAANNQTTSLDEKEMLMANFHAAKVLFEKLFSEHNCKKIVYASSASIYGNGKLPFKETNEPNPLSYYAESKLRFDEWVKKQNFNTVGLRYSNVYGPFENHKKDRASMISQIIGKIKNDETVKLFKHGEQKRDWVYIDDCADANLFFMNSESQGVFNCGSGVQTSFNEIVDLCEKKLSKKCKLEYIDFFMKQTYQANTQLCMEKSKAHGLKINNTISDGIEKTIASELSC